MGPLPLVSVWRLLAAFTLLYIQALMLWQKTCYLRSHRLTESDFWWPKLVCCKATASLFFIGHQPSSYQKYPIRKYDICGIEITCIHHNRRWRGSLGKSCRALVFCAWKKGKNYIQRFYWIYLILIVLIFSWYVCKTLGTTSGENRYIALPVLPRQVSSSHNQSSFGSCFWLYCFCLYLSNWSKAKQILRRPCCLV